MTPPSPQEQILGIFNQAMRDLSASISPAVAASFDWSQFAAVAIGGGIGAELSSILDAHLSCRGVVFDQPAVVAEAVDGRIERVGGDFFKDVPAAGGSNGGGRHAAPPPPGLSLRPPLTLVRAVADQRGDAHNHQDGRQGVLTAADL